MVVVEVSKKNKAAAFSAESARVCHLVADKGANNSSSVRRGVANKDGPLRVGGKINKPNKAVACLVGYALGSHLVAARSKKMNLLLEAGSRRAPAQLHFQVRRAHSKADLARAASVAHNLLLDPVG